MAHSHGSYQPRDTEHSVLHAVIREHLMHRVLDLDVLACPRCGGRLRVLATVQAPRAVQAILASLARSGAPAPPPLLARGTTSEPEPAEEPEPPI